MKLAYVCALSSVITGCVVEPEDAAEDTADAACVDGKCDSPTTFNCAQMPASFAALGTPIPGLLELPGIPLPSAQPAASKFFFPARGYLEGGRFEATVGRVEWNVPANEIAARAPTGSLRVVEFNVERGNKLDKLVRVMKQINADVWILNETDLYRSGSGDETSQNKVIARELASALGYSYVTAIEFYERRSDRKGTSGNAIVSRFPLRDSSAMDIPILEDQGGHDWAKDSAEPRCGQRNALSAMIDAPNAAGGTTAIKLVSMHLENKSNREVRRAQYEAVRSTMVPPGETVIAAGDLNTVSVGEGPDMRTWLTTEWQTHGRDDRMFDCSRGDNSNTFSKLVVAFRIDWMFVQSGAQNTLECPAGGYQVMSSQGASDHKPVVTMMTL